VPGIPNWLGVWVFTYSNNVKDTVTITDVCVEPDCPQGDYWTYIAKGKKSDNSTFQIRKIAFASDRSMYYELTDDEINACGSKCPNATIPDTNYLADGSFTVDDTGNKYPITPITLVSGKKASGSTTTTTSGSTTILTTVPASTSTSTGPGVTTTTSVASSTTTSAGLVTTTTTISGSTTTTTACPATKVLGADNPKLENLRNFRDSKLAQSAIGRKVIQIYYNNSGSINAALERSPALRAVTRRVLETIAPMVGKNE